MWESAVRQAGAEFLALKPLSHNPSCSDDRFPQSPHINADTYSNNGIIPTICPYRSSVQLPLSVRYFPRVEK